MAKPYLCFILLASGDNPAEEIFIAERMRSGVSVAVPAT